MSDTRVRFGLGLAAALAVFLVIVVVVSRLTPSPQGPPSSSYSTTPAGLAAYAAVLERSGRSVRRLRTPIADERPRAGETLIIVEPDSVDPQEARAIASWVRGGGRLVAVVSDESRWLDELMEHPPEWSPDGSRLNKPLVPVTETAGVRSVEALGSFFGGWEKVGSALPVLGAQDAPLAVTAQVGSGSVVLVADPSPLQNLGLARADNAAFGLALAGGRDVAFLETVHGYGVARGFGGLPAAVGWTILGLFLTTLVALWSVGRRFGPPEEQDTPLPPPRVEYVDALAAALVRAKPDKEDGS